MKRIIFEKYVDKVCSIYGITREKLFIRSRVAHVNEPRYLLYYLCLNRGMRMCELMDLLEQNGLDPSWTRQNSGKKNTNLPSAVTYIDPAEYLKENPHLYKD
jgi:hypothetical protein